MRLQFFTLDVFTSRKFAGNPLAAVLDADDLSAEQMQRIAREFNLSETIFVQKPASKSNTAKVRIFFPTGEMPFAGHPTLGCAILLAERRNKPGCTFETEIRLEEEAGLVPVTVTRIGGVSRGMFTAPVVPHAGGGQAPDSELASRALGLAAADVGFDGHRPGVWLGGPSFLYVPVASLDALARCRVSEPHWSAVINAAGTDNAYVYARSLNGGYRARMFAPAAGIIEDPATGSATAILAAPLHAAGELRDGINRLALEQGYEMGRPSDLDLEITLEAGKIEKVRVGGHAVQLMSGYIDF